LTEENSEDITVLVVTLLTSVVLQKNLLIFDGDPHGEYHKIHEDENRDKYLENFGFTVLRFENRFVFQEPESLKMR
jgi:very-short-patch-repair endonuclease